MFFLNFLVVDIEGAPIDANISTLSDEESQMGVFDFEISPIQGARIMVGEEALCPRCLSDGEIDAHVRRLKDELDAVAKRMKAAVRQAATVPFKFR